MLLSMAQRQHSCQSESPQQVMQHLNKAASGPADAPHLQSLLLLSR